MSRGTLDSGSYIQLFAYRTITSYGGAFQLSSAKYSILNASPQPLRSYPLRFGLIPFRSPLLRKSISLSFPPGT